MIFVSQKRIFLKIKRLQVGYGGVAGVHLVAFCKEAVWQIVGPAGFRAFRT